MISLFAVIFFIFGTIIGSFLNVVILRFNTRGGLSGHSGCFACGEQLRWYELIPVVSFFAQKARCRHCGSKLNWQYPIVELLTGFVFYFVYVVNMSVIYSGAPIAVYRILFELIVFSIFIIITVYDMRHMVIPDPLVYFLSALTLLFLFVGSNPSMYALLAGPAVATPFALLWLVSRGKWMGLGDAKLALPIGWLLGLSGGFAAVILAFWIGATVSVFILILKQLDKLSGELSRFRMKSEIPFGPFMVLGTFIVYLFGLDVISLLVF
jgi:prepilin signal peptidase PulO-like enzyme (type II secretory pathway)